jgi:glutathione S-transferase
MLLLLGRLSSINVRKVVWLCAELGIDFEREDWGAGFRDTTEPGFLALNPNALVPVINDDGFVLWESSAILRYLAAKHGGEHLFGGDLSQRAIVDQWFSWQATDLNSAWGYAVQALVRKTPGYDDPGMIERSIANWTRMMAILDGQLGRTGAFVAGEAFSLADIGIGLAVQRWLAPDFERKDFPRVRNYFDRLKAETEISRHGLLDFP